ncbi:MAG: hypothetical protein IPP73_18915 [Chitinophagaceae bacterium]|nr:hypothetical protein [Chitinophagaceae bacterium]
MNIKILIPILFIILFSSCATKIYPLKGTYTNGNFEQITDKSKDQVWENIIDFFSKNGISIRIIARSSGLIISGESSLTWSYENSNGILDTPEACVAIYKLYDPGSRTIFKPYSVTGEWNIRIKEQNGKTLVNINLVNPSYTLAQTSANRTIFQKGYLQSTGNFEKWVYDNIK